MVTINFLGQQIETIETASSLYANEHQVSLEDAIKETVQGQGATFENIERELQALLGRFPTTEETLACMNDEAEE